LRHAEALLLGALMLGMSLLYTLNVLVRDAAAGGGDTAVGNHRH